VITCRAISQQFEDLAAVKTYQLRANRIHYLADREVIPFFVGMRQFLAECCCSLTYRWYSSSVYCHVIFLIKYREYDHSRKLPVVSSSFCPSNCLPLKCVQFLFSSLFLLRLLRVRLGLQRPPKGERTVGDWRSRFFFTCQVAFLAQPTVSEDHSIEWFICQ